MKPTIWGDYHTHTTNSDGHGTLIQTLQAADKLGLKQVGITDHGLRHIARGMKLRDVDKMRRLMEQYILHALLNLHTMIVYMTI